MRLAEQGVRLAERLAEQGWVAAQEVAARLAEQGWVPCTSSTSSPGGSDDDSDDSFPGLDGRRSGATVDGTAHNRLRLCPFDCFPVSDSIAGPRGDISHVVFRADRDDDEPNRQDLPETDSRRYPMHFSKNHSTETTIFFPICGYRIISIFRFAGTNTQHDCVQFLLGLAQKIKSPNAPPTFPRFSALSCTNALSNSAISYLPPLLGVVLHERTEQFGDRFRA